MSCVCPVTFFGALALVDPAIKSSVCSHKTLLREASSSIKQESIFGFFLGKKQILLYHLPLSPDTEKEEQEEKEAVYRKPKPRKSRNFDEPKGLHSA